MKKRGKIRSIFTKHWIGIWIALSVVYALIIQFIFSFTTSNRFIQAHWGAGDILTYASTVSLGLLALWQNKKIQEENDVAQEKLENIIERSNELNIISKIIEHEERRICDLQTEMDSFAQNCDPQAIALALKLNDKVTYLSNITELERCIDAGFFNISRLLAEDRSIKQNDKHPLKTAYANLYILVKQVIKDIQTDKINIFETQTTTAVAEVLSKVRDEFLKGKEEYITEQRMLLHKLLFENLSLEEVRDLYK